MGKFTLKLEPGVTTKLRQSALDFITPYTQQATAETRVPLVFNGEQYLDQDKIKARLDMILADNRLDPLEAPLLLTGARLAAGPDGILSENEVPNVMPAATLAVFGKTKATAFLKDHPNAGALMATDGYENIFDADIKSTDTLLDLLEGCSAVISSNINFTYAYYRSLQEEEASYFTFTNLENLWGLSYTLFGRTGSSYRIEATYKVLSELLDMANGLEILHHSISIGYFPEDSPQVNAFLNGPLAALVDMDILRGESGRIHLDGHAKALSYVQKMVALANKHEATELGILYTQHLTKLLSDDERQAILPDTMTYAYEMVGRRVTNALLSLTAVGAYAGGRFLGAGLASSVTARKAILGAAAAMGSARYLLPGINWLQNANTVRVLPRVARAILSFLFEFMKAHIYITTGRAVDDTRGENIAGLLFMGGGGVTSGYLQGAARQLSAEIAIGKADGIIAQRIRAGMTVDDQIFTAETTARVRGMQTFRLHMVSENAVAENYNAITGIRRQIQTEAELAALRTQEATVAAKKLSTAIEKLDPHIARAQKLADKLSSTQSGALMDRVREISAITDPNQLIAAKRAIGELVKHYAEQLRIAEQAIRDAARASTPSIPKRAVSRATIPSGPTSVTKPGTRAERLAGYEPGKTPPEGTPSVDNDPTPLQGATTTPNGGTPIISRLSPLAEELIKRPPVALDEITIQKLTGDSVRFTNGVQRTLQNFYTQNPTLRQAIIRRLDELPKVYRDRLLDGMNWKELESIDNAFSGKLGISHRLLVKKIGNEFEIYGVRSRGSLDNSKPWK